MSWKSPPQPIFFFPQTDKLQQRRINPSGKSSFLGRRRGGGDAKPRAVTTLPGQRQTAIQDNRV